MESLRHSYITDMIVQGRILGKDKSELRAKKSNIKGVRQRILARER